MKKQKVPEIHIDTKIKNKGRKNSTYLFIKPVISVIIIIICAIFAGIIGSSIYKPLKYIAPVIFIMFVYLINNSRKNKKIKDLYEQMDKFMKRCCNDSYNDLALYFGTIYTNFEGNLSKAMEKCYMTAIQSNDSNRALKEFKGTYGLEYFSFCIDTLQTIKSNEVQISADYLYKQTKSRLGMIQMVHKEKTQSRADIILLTIFSAILIILMNYLFEMNPALFFTPIGIILSIILVILFLSGIL